MVLASDRLGPAVLPLCLAAAAAGWLAAVLTRRKASRSTALNLPARPATTQNGGPQSPGGSTTSSAAKLRALLAERRDIIVMPCCYDGLTARLIERAGFQPTFMTGFGVSAAHGFADCQLVSYQEMLDAAFRICGSWAYVSTFKYSHKSCHES